MSVSVTSEAMPTLDAIWDWNAAKFDAEHADTYVAFVLAGVKKLSTEFPLARPIPTAPDLRYRIIRRRRSGHGRLAVFRRVVDRIEVLEFYHTAQNWQADIARRTM